MVAWEQAHALSEALDSGQASVTSAVVVEGGSEHSLPMRVELCASTMAQAGWTEDDLLAGVEVVPAAYPRVIDLQLQGYAHIVFD